MLDSVLKKLSGAYLIKQINFNSEKIVSNFAFAFTGSPFRMAIAPYSSMLQRRNILSKMEGVFAMQAIIDKQGYDVEICTGIYDAAEIARYAAHGVKSAFIWEKDVESCLTQDLVDEAAANFEDDWAKIDRY